MSLCAHADYFIIVVELLELCFLALCLQIILQGNIRPKYDLFSEAYLPSAVTTAGNGLVTTIAQVFTTFCTG